MKKIYIFVLVHIFFISFTYSQSKNQITNFSADKSKNVKFYKTSNQTKQLKGSKSNWVVQFNKAINAGGVDQAGVETDGNFIYTAQWNSDTIIKYDMLANFIEKFTISGVSYLRDLAFDGTYFYGGSVDSIIYKMNFNTKTLIGKISCPSGVEVRHIAFDESLNSFWVGNWASDILLINKAGVILDTIPAASHKLANIYGSAYDNITLGGPYLWVFNQGGNYCDIVQLSIPAKKPTGLIHDATIDVALNSVGAVAGGLFTYTDISTGTTILGGLYQGNPNGVFAYTLSSIYVAKDASVTKLLSPVTSCGLGSNEKIKITVKNLGFDTLYNLVVSYLYNSFVVTDTLPDPLNPYESYDFQFDFGIYMIPTGNYNITTYTSLPNDEYNNNDTLSVTISNVFPFSPPYSNGFEPLDDMIGWKIEDGNNDDYTWYQSNTGGYTNPSCFVYSWNPNGIYAADDWLFSTCLSLDAGKYYAVKFLTKVALSTYPESLELFIGTNAYSGAMTTSIKDLSYIDTENYVVVYDSFSVAQTGTYYLGWHVYSAADNFMLFIDDIVIDESVGIEEAPKTINLNIYPNPAKDVLFVKASYNIKNIKFYNALGQLLMTKIVDDNFIKISTTNFDKGIHYIQIDSDEDIVTRKVSFVD